MVLHVISLVACYKLLSQKLKPMEGGSPNFFLLFNYKCPLPFLSEATSAKVGHFILVTSLGTNEIGFPAAILK